MKKLLNLLTILFLLISARNYAGAGINNHYEEDVLTSNASTTQANPLYIKLYLILLKPESGPGGWTNQDVSEFENLLEQIYGIRDIHFNLCIFEIKDSYWYGVKINEGNIFPFLNEKHLNFDDGIKGVVGASSGDGAANGIPGWAFNAPNAQSAAHELGHNLGLLHTFEEPSSTNGYPDCGENAPYVDGSGVHYGANATYTGDLVEDTPADLTRVYSNCPQSGKVKFGGNYGCELLNPLHISDDANPSHEYRDLIDPVTGLNSLASNIMSYNHSCSLKLITPGQAARIRVEVQTIHQVVQTAKYATVYAQNYYITQNTIWDNKQLIINGNIYVFGDIKFDIKDSEIYFAPGMKIYLHEGSFVTINSTLLDVAVISNCFDFPANSTWGGIQYDYTANSSSTNRTMLDISGSYINNAENAISNFSVIGSKKLLLWINSSVFTDNRTSINLTNCASSFIRIKDSDFKFNRQNDSEYKAQMYFTDALPFFTNVQILNAVNNIIDEKFCGIEYFNSHLMAINLDCKGWYYGLRGTDGSGKLLRINESEFSNNGDVGIKINRLVSTIRIKDSRFENNLNSGIYTYQMKSSDIDLSNNIFDASRYGINIDRNERGLFYNNLFKNNVNTKGIFFDNYTQTQEALFLCNIMNNPSDFDQIHTEGGIFPYQSGYSDNLNNYTSAGNKFLHNIPSIDFNFTSNMIVKPLYFYYKPNVVENPIKNSGIKPIEWVIPSGCAENYFGTEDDYTPGNGDTSDDDKKYNDTNDEVVSVQDTLNVNLDGGNTTGVIILINNANTSNAGQVTQYLMGLGPWLSEQSAVALINNADVFTGEQMVSIFAESPDVLVTETVYQFCFGPNSTLSTNQQNVLRNVYGQVTQRTRLLIKLNYLNMKLTHIIGGAVTKVVYTADGTIDYNNLRSWYGKRGIFRSRFDIAQSFMDEGDYTGSINYISAQLSDRTLSAEEINELNHYLILTQLLVEVYNDLRYEGSLNHDEIAQMERIANTGTEFAQGKARGILEFFYGYVFTELESRDDKQWNFKKPAQENNNSELVIMPNPSNGEFDVINGLKEKAIAVIRIYSLDGQLVFVKDYPEIEGNIKVNLDGAKGTFLYQATDRSGKVYSGKLIVK